MNVGRFRLTGGFLLLLSRVLYVDTQGLLMWLLLAAALHELGHVAVTLLLGGSIESCEFFGLGVSMEVQGLSYGGEIAATLAGCAVNILVAVMAALCAHIYRPLALFAGLNLTLCAFNLLPAPCLDGGHAILLLLNWRELSAQWAALVGTALSAALLLVVGALYSPVSLVDALAIVYIFITRRNHAW